MWIYNGARAGRCFGNAADYICLSEDLVYELPDRTSFAEGATLGIPAMTAHCCLFSHGEIWGKRVLVTGGAGAVGHYALQLARWAGAALTIATVSSAAKGEIARRGGADHTIHYRDEDVAARVLALTEGRGVDHVVDVDFGSNLAACIKALALNGSWASLRLVESALADGVGPRAHGQERQLAVLDLEQPPARGTQASTARGDSVRRHGGAIHNIAGRFALQDSVAAHELVESGTKLGTVVVEHGSGRS